VDFLGWTMLAMLVLGVAALSFFGGRLEARRMAAARAWATAAGLRELSLSERKVPTRRRDRSLPAFKGSLRDSPLTVIQTSGYSHGHYVWSLRTTATSLPALYVVSRFEDVLSRPWRRAESAHPELRARGWSQVKTGDTAFDARIIVWSPFPDGASWLEPALRAALLDRAFISLQIFDDHAANLRMGESSGTPLGEVLVSGLAILTQALGTTSYREPAR
jgi:hypothetical protein